MFRKLTKLSLIALSCLSVWMPTIRTGGHPLAVEDPKYIATVSGDVSGGPTCRIGMVTKNSSQFAFREMTLDLSYFQTVTFKTAGDGAQCFNAGVYGETTMSVTKLKNGTALIRKQINAKGNNGTTDVSYVLEMYGTFADSANWPPANGTSNTVLIDSWEMLSTNKNKQISCVGNGIREFTNGVTAVVERDDAYSGFCPCPNCPGS